MIELRLLNERGQTFSKFFDNEYQCEKFKSKLRYSKKLTLVGEFKNW